MRDRITPRIAPMLPSGENDGVPASENDRFVALRAAQREHRRGAGPALMPGLTAIMNKLLSVRTWQDLEACLSELYALPSFEAARREDARTAARTAASASEAARRKVAEIRSGSLESMPQPREFVGPRRFYRAIGQRAYSGEWWFEEEQLLHLEGMTARLFTGRERAQAIRDALREVTAVSIEWNPFRELWRLELPPGERITGLVSRAAPQLRSQQSPAGRRLVGHTVQIFFPVKNPLWVHRHGDLA